LSKLNQIIDIDEKSLVATVQAGVVGPVLEKELNEKGLTLSHYPGSYYHGAQIGGYVAARGSGVVSTKYGKAENMVLQIEAVVPPGRIIKTLPVPSHATGPDLLQVFTGSEGTLGVITELSMRLDPMPPTRSFQAFSFPDIFAGMEAGRLIMTSRLRPAVIRLYDKPASEKLANWVGTGFHGNLMVIVCDGVDELVKYESRSIHELCIRAGGTFIGPEIAETWWVGKYEPYAQGKLPVPPVLYGTFDTVARFRDIPRIYEAKKKIIEEEFAEYNAHYTAHLSHWYEWGAMLYDRFYIDKAPDDPAEALELHDRLWNAGVGASLANGGAVNEHHGIGLKLGRFMRPQFGEAFELLKGLKNAWDPQGIMNPGKLGLGPPSGQRIPE
jgi:alkyldihydroxyacetonephosphate synthase